MRAFACFPLLMSASAQIPLDALTTNASPEVQRLAARMAQDVFSGIFRQAFDTSGNDFAQTMSEVEQRCYNWCRAAENEEAQALRMALLVSGLDQWGLAYCQAFQLAAMPALSALIGALRGRLEVRAEACFQWYFNQIDQIESDAVDFKIELRRAIHLALWHAIAACEESEDLAGLLQALGSLMLALNDKMPQLGWRLLADALAHIQIQLLDGRTLSEQAHASAQQLFEALRQALPQARYREIMGHATQVVLAWQQSRRPAVTQ